MGAYLYALQKPETVTEVELDGERVPLGTLRYAYKPYVGGTSTHRQRQANEANSIMDSDMVAPLRKAWRGSKVTRPRFVTVGDTTGMDKIPVYNWPVKWITCLDDGNFGETVKQIGWLENGKITRGEL